MMPDRILGRGGRSTMGNDLQSALHAPEAHLGIDSKHLRESGYCRFCSAAVPHCLCVEDPEARLCLAHLAKKRGLSCDGSAHGRPRIEHGTLEAQARNRAGSVAPAVLHHDSVAQLQANAERRSERELPPANPRRGAQRRPQTRHPAAPQGAVPEQDVPSRWWGGRHAPERRPFDM